VNAATNLDGGADSATANQYLTFQLAGQNYGIPILSVQEIKGWDKPTRLPHSPEHVLGVINLRGAVVPIIDLRRRFELGAGEYSPTTVVIVVRVVGERGALTAGIVVDAVCGVSNVDSGNLRAVPEVGSSIDGNFISGIATLDDHMLILLAIDAVVADALSEPASAAKAA
jgi:purine-binding chemotaxis protein CheW